MAMGQKKNPSGPQFWFISFYILLPKGLFGYPFFDPPRKTCFRLTFDEFEVLILKRKYSKSYFIIFYYVRSTKIIRSEPRKSICSNKKAACKPTKHRLISRDEDVEDVHSSQGAKGNVNHPGSSAQRGAKHGSPTFRLGF